MRVIAGIDFSMSSPAITIHTGNEWSFNNCEFHFFQNPKKINFESIIKDFPFLHPYQYSENIQSGIERYSYLSEWILSILLKLDNIEMVFLEGYSYNSIGKRIFEIGENTGILKFRLYNNNIPIKIIQPTIIKKYATLHGNANKQLLETIFITETKINLRSILNQTNKQFNPSSDIIDSYYLVKYGYSTTI
jgi:hypothetical protein